MNRNFDIILIILEILVLVTITTQDESSLPLCSHDQIMDGQWMHHLEQASAPPWVKELEKYDSLCQPPALFNSSHHIAWRWIPNDSLHHHDSTPPKCRFSHMNQFCSVLRNETILIIGDSLSLEHYQYISKIGRAHV